ncbi:MAG: hypothetical protein HZB10_01445 [Candidatus Yonathbacteria bacterium]|nr:hypothetical protein [Candidatus Yonathbacteria bacterium]
MFGFWKKFIKDLQNRWRMITQAKGSWDGASDCFYIVEYRKQIDAIAQKLSPQDGRPPVQTRFNPKRRCAELFCSDGILARVHVHGECGLSYAAIVTSNLSEESRAVFNALLPLPVRHRSF